MISELIIFEFKITKKEKQKMLFLFLYINKNRKNIDKKSQESKITNVFELLVMIINL